MKGKRMKSADAGLLKYLESDGSERSVGQIALNKLNEATNLRVRILAEIQEWVLAKAWALHAEWILQRRKRARECEMCANCGARVKEAA